jgi:hypothetical protein
MTTEPLLTIDVQAELRKLSTAAAEGPLHLPAELVRRAVAARATRVELGFERRALVAHDDGEPISLEELERLLALLDPEAPATERHRALVALEARPGFLALAAPEADLRVETGPPGRRHVLSRERGGRPAIRSEYGRGRAAGTIVTLRGPDADLTRARTGAWAACRFAPIPVFIDGRAVPRGFTDAVAQAALEPPLEGRLALPRQGEAGSLLLLYEGAIASRLTVPDSPAFEAVVEMRGLSAGGSGGALREAVFPHLGAIVDQAVDLAIRVGAGLPELDPADQGRVRALVLAAARRRGRRGEVLRLPVLRALRGPEGGSLWLSLLDLGRDREAAYIEPGHDPRSFLLPAVPVLVLDAEERGRLAQLLGLRFRAPDRRRMAAPLAARLRRARAEAVAGLLRLVRRLRHPRLGRELSERDLTAEERRLIHALRSCDPGCEVVATDGVGPVRTVGPGRWAVPRRNADVVACVGAVARHGAWAYPAVLALLSGRAPRAPEARRAWRDRPDGSGLVSCLETQGKSGSGAFNAGPPGAPRIERPAS